MDNFSNEIFWQQISIELKDKTGLGMPSTWNKSTIEIFIYSFLEEIEEACLNNFKKAKFCNIPIIKNKVLVDQLRFSYDSFRRIFLSKESNGSKTTKNMFSIYLGYNSYIDFWVKKNEVHIDQSNKLSNTSKNEKTDNLLGLHTKRLRGENFIDLKLYNYYKLNCPDSEKALVELGCFYFSKFGNDDFHKKIEVLFSFENLNSNFVKRTINIFECISLLGKTENSKILKRKYLEVEKYNDISLLESNYFNFWEGLILLFCREFKLCNSKWSSFSGNRSSVSNQYPDVGNLRKFERVIFQVILGNESIEQTIQSLDINAYRCLAHYSAMNCKLIRKNEPILRNIIELGKKLNWKSIPNFQESWQRLYEYEKQVLSNAGTLFNNNFNLAE